MRWGLTGVPGALPRPFVGAAHSPSSVSLSGVEVRSWSPVSEARGWRGQSGECWIRSVKSPDICAPAPPCPSQEPSMAPIFAVKHTIKPGAGEAFPRVRGARCSLTHSFPLQDEESYVTQHAAHGWCKGYWDPGEGQMGTWVQDGVGGLC